MYAACELPGGVYSQLALHATIIEGFFLGQGTFRLYPVWFNETKTIAWLNMSSNATDNNR